MSEKVKEQLLALPFDQFERYKIIKDITVKLAPSTKLKILDVGGYPGLIVDFLPEHEITVVDILPSQKPYYVQASGDNLPFNDSSFDLVCSCDTLEHVPAAKREAFLAELVRVTKNWLILCAPFADPRTELAEQILYAYVQKVLFAEFTTLKEHLDNGLPALNETLMVLNSHGLKTVNFPSGYLYNWLPMMIIKHHLLSFPETEELHAKLDKFYNLNVASQDHGLEPSYRQVIISSKQAEKNFLATLIKDYKFKQPEEKAEFIDRLEVFRLLADLLDVRLTRDIAVLVKQTNEINEQLKKELAEKEKQINDLQNVVTSQNQTIDELFNLVNKVRNFWPYKIYCRLFKSRPK